MPEKIYKKKRKNNLLVFMEHMNSQEFPLFYQSRPMSLHKHTKCQTWVNTRELSTWSFSYSRVELNTGWSQTNIITSQDHTVDLVIGQIVNGISLLICHLLLRFAIILVHTVILCSGRYNYMLTGSLVFLVGGGSCQNSCYSAPPHVALCHFMLFTKLRIQLKGHWNTLEDIQHTSQTQCKWSGFQEAI